MILERTNAVACRQNQRTRALWDAHSVWLITTMPRILPVSAASLWHPKTAYTQAIVVSLSRTMISEHVWEKCDVALQAVREGGMHVHLRCDVCQQGSEFSLWRARFRQAHIGNTHRIHLCRGRDLLCTGVVGFFKEISRSNIWAADLFTMQKAIPRFFLSGAQPPKLYINLAQSIDAVFGNN